MSNQFAVSAPFNSNQASTDSSGAMQRQAQQDIDVFTYPQRIQMNYEVRRFGEKPIRLASAMS